MNNSKTFQGIIVDGRVNKTKAIILALLKAESNIPNIETPDEYTNIPIDISNTSMGIKNQHIKKEYKL